MGKKKQNELQEALFHSKSSAKFFFRSTSKWTIFRPYLHGPSKWSMAVHTLQQISLNTHCSPTSTASAELWLSVFYLLIIFFSFSFFLVEIRQWGHTKICVHGSLLVLLEGPYTGLGSHISHQSTSSKASALPWYYFLTPSSFISDNAVWNQEKTSSNSSYGDPGEIILLAEPWFLHLS